MVSKAREDLPEPDRPVKTTSLSRGITRSIFLRLCSRAPRTTMARWSKADGAIRGSGTWSRGRLIVFGLVSFTMARIGLDKRVWWGGRIFGVPPLLIWCDAHGVPVRIGRTAACSFDLLWIIEQRLNETQ